VSMFGVGWLGWGLGLAKAFSGFVPPVFGCMAFLLWGSSLYFIRKGRLLRRKFPPLPPSKARAVHKQFWLVVLFEALAILAVGILASHLQRPDLGADWCALVVGLHFLPLAKVLQSPPLALFGVLIMSWALAAWALFRSNTLVVGVDIGTGILLCAISISALLYARKLVHSLC
jgi:hypothetical protein